MHIVYTRFYFKRASLVFHAKFQIQWQLWSWSFVVTARSKNLSRKGVGVRGVHQKHYFELFWGLRQSTCKMNYHFFNGKTCLLSIFFLLVSVRLSFSLLLFLCFLLSLHAWFGSWFILPRVWSSNKCHSESLSLSTPFHPFSLLPFQQHNGNLPKLTSKLPQ